ncbi:hypothetical protein O1V64_00240 (plasmid) [Rouxiella badensis]|uniref:Uncharacterized protein n=1 Tax=Rouxiella badensis TaxID=1646377 RepID=A0A1X0WB57_9GAMM|nr:hypothetical protein [Rouxiella badensis]ORJ23945.1 hypothetical protein BS640_18765 [Rouxiella badensis]WAT03193.1 hypothetical protein O1V64_00475 [Rouxiella badensis]WAT03286.1 hypothetical protein O1V64_00240 [Rouxiella badensis]
MQVLPSPDYVIVSVKAFSKDGTQLMKNKCTVSMLKIKTEPFPVLAEAAAACAIQFEERLVDAY